MLVEDVFMYLGCFPNLHRWQHNHNNNMRPTNDLLANILFAMSVSCQPKDDRKTFGFFCFLLRWIDSRNENVSYCEGFAISWKRSKSLHIRDEDNQNNNKKASIFNKLLCWKIPRNMGKVFVLFSHLWWFIHGKVSQEHHSSFSLLSPNSIWSKNHFMCARGFTFYQLSKAR